MVRLYAQPFDPAEELRAFSHGLENAGAIVSFTGVVRNEGERRVRALHLDHAPGLTLPEIERAAADARARWDLLGLMVIHRIGEVFVGDPVVLVAIASAHRRAAFEACDFMMDYLKTDAPFWKKEMSAHGDCWIEPRDDDYRGRARWVEANNGRHARNK